MHAFGNTDELHRIMEGLWNHIAEDGAMSQQLVKTQLIVRFNYTEPEGQLTVDASDGHTLKVYVGKCDLEAHIEMTMKAEVANEFWSGALNVPAAFVAGKIRTRGPVQKVLALIPVIGPARSLYPAVVQRVKDKAA
jgi:putative sterol carrier protein